MLTGGSVRPLCTVNPPRPTTSTGPCVSPGSCGAEPSLQLCGRDDFVAVDDLFKPLAGGERDIASRLRDDAKPLIGGQGAAGYRVDVESALHPLPQCAAADDLCDGFLAGLPERGGPAVDDRRDRSGSI